MRNLHNLLYSDNVHLEIQLLNKGFYIIYIIPKIHNKDVARINYYVQCATQGATHPNSMTHWSTHFYILKYYRLLQRKRLDNIWTFSGKTYLRLGQVGLHL